MKYSAFINLCKSEGQKPENGYYLGDYIYYPITITPPIKFSIKRKYYTAYQDVDKTSPHYTEAIDKLAAHMKQHIQTERQLMPYRDEIDWYFTFNGENIYKCDHPEIFAKMEELFHTLKQTKS